MRRKRESQSSFIIKLIGGRRVREEACERERCVRAVNPMWQALEKITNFLSVPAFSLY